MQGNIGLLLEGGGMRCAYTSGVLDYFIDEGISFPIVSAASAGAFIGLYYIAHQRNSFSQLLQELRNYQHFISFRRFIKQKELFEMDYMFDRVPNEIIPLNYDSFTSANTTFVVGTTDTNTGETVYFDTFKDKQDLLTITRASSSLPVLSRSIPYQGWDLVDGGVSDPIPIKPLLERGFNKNIVILTRNKGYIKKASRFIWLFKKIYRDKPALLKALQTRHKIYNDTMNVLREMEQRQEVFIIQPEKPLVTSRIEKNNQKLLDLYRQGYEEAASKKEALIRFINH